MTDDQQNIKRIRSEERREQEWKSIHKEMEAGSDGLTQEDMKYFEQKTSTALILQDLEQALQAQTKTLEIFSKQDWDDQAEQIAQGWCEALKFAIKIIERHTNCKP